MRKIALLAAFAAVAGASAVQAQAGSPPDRPRPEGRGAGGRGGMGGPGMGADRALLKGITLSDAQKAQLKTLRETERAKMEANGQQGRGGNMQAMQTARQNGDTATMRRLMQEQRGQMEARRNEQTSAIRGILTSDQVAQFDANVAEMKSRADQMGPMGSRGGARGRGARPPKP